MRTQFAILLSCFLPLSLASTNLKAAQGDDAWVVRGRVVNLDGQPAPEVDVAWYWSANGTPRDVDGKPWSTPQDKEAFLQEIADDGWKAMWRDVGAMEPKWYHDHTRTGTDGRFSLKVGRKQGAIIAMDARASKGPWHSSTVLRGISRNRWCYAIWSRCKDA